MAGESGLSPRGDRWVARTRGPLDVLAVVFLVAFLLQWGFPGAPEPWPQVLNGVTWAVWGAFVVDYLVRFFCAIDRRGFVRTHKLDLLMVLLPMLRLLRVVLLLRRALESVPTERIATSIVSIVAVFIPFSAFLVWRAEAADPAANITSFRIAIWWAFVTTTTVGYGDYTPVTPAGRAIAVFVMLVGVGLIGTVSATVASYFVKRPSEGAPETSSAEGDDGSDDAPRSAPTAGSVQRWATAGDAAALMQRLDDLAAEQKRISDALDDLARRT